jgi:hypothetical protein
MKSAVLLLVAALVASGGCASAERPQSVVDAFYSAHLPHRMGGLPSGDELRRLQPFLSQRLHGLITAALAYQEDWIKQNPPDEKPPFVDGDYFSSLFEGPSSFKVSRVVKEQDGWHVHVQFKYDSAPDWEDVVVVKQEDGRYVIDDVLFSGAGEFNSPGRLSERLKPMP